MASYPNILFILLTLTLSTVCFGGILLTEALKGGFSVELIHRDSPKSVLHNPTQTPFQQLNNAVHRSFQRFNHFYPNSQVLAETPQPVISSEQGEYFVKFSIGTPPFEVEGVFDTGSDLIWVKCRELRQRVGFDPTKSSTYISISCLSSDCPVNGICDYRFPACEYATDIFYRKPVAFETLTFTSSNGSSVEFAKIKTGCGYVEYLGPGVLALGAGSISLINQLGPSFDFKFSYCLVPFLQSKTTSHLNFGQNAVVSGPNTVSTPIIPGPVDTFYYLNLEGMSVGSKRLEFEVDSTPNDAKGNIIIDSGTTLTLLPNQFYSKLESEVAAQIKLERVHSPNKNLSLCYKSPANKAIEAPLVTAHFSGADVVLSSENTFIRVLDDVTCFAFAPVLNGSIFGSIAQTNHLIGYDLKKKTVSFKPTDCTKV